MPTDNDASYAKQTPTTPYWKKPTTNVQATSDFYKANPVQTVAAYSRDPSQVSIGGNYQMPQMPQYPRSGGSGGGGYGGGGGGGGGLSAEQQAALLRLAQNPALMQFSPYQAPQYQQYRPEAMGTQVYDVARRRIGQAASDDRTRAQQAYAPVLEMLRTATNPMANAQWATTPALQNRYQAIMGQGVQAPDSIAQENAYSQNSDNAFGNLMAVLASQEQRNMASRSLEGQQALAGALGGIDASSRGMLGGVEMSQLQAQEADRLRRDQIAREEARYAYDQNAAQAYANWQAQMGVNQGNVGIRNETIQALLGLIPGITSKDLLASLQAPGVSASVTPASQQMYQAF